MPFFRAFFEFLNASAQQPKLYGLFHIIWVAVAAVSILTLWVLWKKEIIKEVNKVLIATAVVLAIFELYKQINVIFGDGTRIGYDFDFFPYQYNTLLIYLGIIGGMTKNKVHNSICAFVGTYLLYIGAFGLFYPNNLFSEVIGRNVQVMVSYGAMVVVGVFLWLSGKVKPELKTFLKALPTFLMVYALSLTFNVIPHVLKMNMDTGNLLGSCPICNLGVSIWRFVLLSAIAFLVVLVAFAIKKLLTTDFDAEYGNTDELARDIRKDVGFDGEGEGVFNFRSTDNSPKDTYLQTYFKNLKTNFGNNIADSCGYVAVAMLLSYYDTILHDKIVPRKFDRVSRADNEPNLEESPGIGYFDHPEFHSEEGAEKISYNRYMELVNANKNTYLHEALVAIGAKIGIADIPNDKKSTDFSFGTTNDVREKLIKYYFKNVAKLEKSNYEIQSVDFIKEINEAQTPDLVKKYSNQVREYTIKKIKKGHPVLLSIFGNKGHAVIAYDYNKKTDEIYCHFGSANAPTHATPEQLGYDVYRSAMVLEFDEDNISHSHTNNYEVVINGAIFYYCPKDGTYTTCDDLIIEFDKTKQNCAILGVEGKYYKNQLYIPESYGNVTVAKIHEGAFANQRHIDEVRLPFTLAVIEKNTFNHDVVLKTVIIPRSVVRIKRNAFKNCEELKTIMYLGTKKQWLEIRKASGWDKNTGNYRIRCTDGFLIKHNEGKDSETLV